MRLICKITLAIATIFILGGCCPCRKGKNNVAFSGTQWQVVRIMGRDLTFDNDKFVFTFNGGALAGMGACNRFMAQYSTTESGALKIEGLALTRMMCEDAELEAEFSTILNRATHFEIDGDMLLILSNGEMQAVLRAI